MNKTTTNRPSRAALCISAVAVLATAAGSLAGPVLALDRQFKAMLIDVQRIEAGSVTFLPLGGKQNKPDLVTRPLADFAAFLPPDIWIPGEDRPLSWRASPDSAAAMAEPADTGEAAAPADARSTRLATAAERSGLGIVELVDGQRLIGSLETQGEPPPADALVWSHRSIGRVVLPLDMVRRVRMEGPGVTMPATIDAAQDIVLLGNGDTVSGLIEKITATEVWSTPKGSGGKGDPIRTPLGRVCELRLANPAITAAPPLPRSLVWLEDGSLVAADANSLSMGGDSDRVLLGGIGAEVRGRPALGTSADSVSLGRLRALSINGARFVPLSTLQVAAQSPSSDRLFGGPVIVGSFIDAPLAIADVLLPGPMTAEWVLPVGADRLAGWLVLPETCRDWGACRVTLLLENTELFAQNLSGTESVVAFNVALPTGSVRPAAQRLKIIVESGERGPVQDQVLLRRVIIGVGPAGSPPARVPAKAR